MQATSSTYKALLANVLHEKEYYAEIAGVEYGQDKIMSCSVSGGLFSGSTLMVGGAVSRELDLTLVDPGEIPRMAKIKLYCRLILRDLHGVVLQTSEWIPKGVFYIDTRQVSYFGTLTIHGYDAMLKAEATYLIDGTSEDEWPKPMDEVVADIASRMGVSLDNRTSINPDYSVGYPLDYTMRELLQHIAAAHGGNWTITDAEELRLVTLHELPEETSCLVDNYGRAITFGGVKILV